jgi:hypothetical protein
MAGDREELTSNTGRPLAYYAPTSDATYKPGGLRIGYGNRLAGMMVGRRQPSD